MCGKTNFFNDIYFSKTGDEGTPTESQKTEGVHETKTRFGAPLELARVERSV
jgi:hypothetical protein